VRECAAVRDLLPEHALGALPAEEVRRVEAHLAWCAGCRREHRELAEGMEAAARLAGPADPPPGLEERVVASVRRTAGRRSRRSTRVAALVAALVAVGAMGWGAAMADRAQRLDDAAEVARDDAAAAAERFARAVEELPLAGRSVREAVLRPTGDGTGGGRALVYDAEGEGVNSWVLVIAGGVEDEEGPYRARLLGKGIPLRVGPQLYPSAPGRQAAYLLFRGDAGAYTDVVVVNGDGRPVLRGTFNG
jgi:hypothetical protein